MPNEFKLTDFQGEFETTFMEYLEDFYKHSEFYLRNMNFSTSAWETYTTRPFLPFFEQLLSKLSTFKKMSKPGDIPYNGLVPYAYLMVDYVSPHERNNFLEVAKQLHVFADIHHMLARHLNIQEVASESGLIELLGNL